MVDDLHALPPEQSERERAEIAAVLGDLAGRDYRFRRLVISYAHRVQPNSVTLIDVTKLTPLFKLVFLAITGLTVLAFSADLFLVLMLDKPGEDAQRFLELCSTIAMMGSRPS
ncbi:hypothetical protein RB614_42130 [Phytohabitans sp. ZYX-F-186]|uniref:Uncharacterized protein n=1 Tax=Phytohabitans maris TaxID=3071409 RepID=A0ABU0ZW03_9ACTN|nr:hypothetical protein [Phytohabitans sp. ZYX-F-186]MDQ7911108.1 hypothetical protein [Phytohabitans sp. ZYX-F-186]